MTPLGWLSRKTSTQTVQYSLLSTTFIDTTRYTTSPESLLIHFSILTAPVPVYWYVAAQSITAPDKVLLIPYSPQLPQYQSYWHDTVHYCPSTSSIDILQSTFAPVPILLIPYSPLLPRTNHIYTLGLLQPKHQFYWYNTVHYRPLYGFYWYPIVHYCPSTRPADWT